jgi:Uma2 family endonuclease
MRDLLLVVEVLSPSSSRGDRFTKRRLYQERGIPVYWIVDGEERLVEVWTPDAEFPTIERDRLTWSPEGAARSFTLTLKDLFRPI